MHCGRIAKVCRGSIHDVGAVSALERTRLERACQSSVYQQPERPPSAAVRGSLHRRLCQQRRGIVYDVGAVPTLNPSHQFTEPAHRADQAAFAHTVKAPLGVGLIYSPRCCTWDQIRR
jgi:hypothetical protein